MSVRLPIGIEWFREIREKGSYYVDKTEAIKELFDEDFKVILVTRPRRFGKTLFMDTLREFFDIRRDSRELFEGLQQQRLLTYGLQRANYRFPFSVVFCKDPHIPYILRERCTRQI